MAQMREDFDPASTERVERNTGDPIPDKVIALVELIESDIIDTTAVKDGSKGTAFKGTMVVKTGPYEMRRAWPFIALTNSNQKYAAEGRSEFAELCDAIGHSGKLRDTQDLHFRPFYVEFGVKMEKARDDPKKRTPRQFQRKYFKKGETPQITMTREPSGGGVPAHGTVPSTGTGAPADGAPDWMKSRG
mgnify:CR=1 FL=1